MTRAFAASAWKKVRTTSSPSRRRVGRRSAALRIEVEDESGRSQGVTEKCQALPRIGKPHLQPRPTETNNKDPESLLEGSGTLDLTWSRCIRRRPGRTVRTACVTIGQALKGDEPGVLRFPGGASLKADILSNVTSGKTTIGDMDDRRLS